MKRMKKVFAFLLASITVLATLSLPVAAEGEEYQMFLAFGGDLAESNDWGLQYYGDGAASNAGDITPANATVKAGDTVTIGLTMPSEVVYTWFMAPVLVAEGVTNVDYTIDSIKLDGEDVLADVDLAAGDAWWYEGTGDYTETQAVRLAGGYNEWGAKYFAEAPTGFTTIEYTITLNSVEASAAEAGGVAALTPAGPDEEFPMFLAIGADKDESNDWALAYYGEGAADNVGDITAANAAAHVGDTVTIGLTMPSPVLYTWFLSPVLIAEGVGDVDYTVDSIKLDGEDVLADVDLTAGDAWWYEGTGAYTAEQSVRLAGGYNEWGTKYMAEAPAGFTTIEYTITLNAVQYGSAVPLTPSTESYDAFIAIGADLEAENDWLLSYTGEETPMDGVTVTNGQLKNGETTTLSLEFANPVVNVWYVSPCMVVENPETVSNASTFDVKVYLDGEEVDVDMSAGDSCWAEGTGDYQTNCVRIAGGYNEWGAQYIAEPAGFTNITFEITPNILLAPVEEAPQFEFDPEGTYHAYIGIQTPTWIFRNAYNDATYGLESGCFDELGYVDGEWLPQGGTFTDAEITGNGTYTVAVNGFDFSGTFNDQAILGDAGNFNLLFVSTDLPVNDQVVLSNVVLKMDGKEITTIAEPTLDPDSKEVQSIMLVNNWNSELPALPYFAAPTSSVEISFDVTGFANDKPAEEAPAESSEAAEPEASSEAAPESSEAAPASSEAAPASSEAPAQTSSGSNTGIIVGVVVAVVAVAAVAGVIVSKKKKKG